MEMNLRGKTVLITGAAKGIGRATALGFAKEGSRLALVDIDRADLESLAGEIKSMGGEAAYGIGDLSTANGVTSSVAEALRNYGSSLDVLVNNVGSGAVRTFDQLSDEDWEKTIQLNFMSYVRATRAILPGMRQKGSGVIINNASDLRASAGAGSQRLFCIEGGGPRVHEGTSAVGGTEDQSQRGCARSDLDAVLVEARRICGHVRCVPQNAAEGSR